MGRVPLFKVGTPSPPVQGRYPLPLNVNRQTPVKTLPSRRKNFELKWTELPVWWLVSPFQRDDEAHVPWKYQRRFTKLARIICTKIAVWIQRNLLITVHFVFVAKIIAKLPKQAKDLFLLFHNHSYDFQRKLEWHYPPYYPFNFNDKVHKDCRNTPALSFSFSIMKAILIIIENEIQHAIDNKYGNLNLAKFLNLLIDQWIRLNIPRANVAQTEIFQTKILLLSLFKKVEM